MSEIKRILERARQRGLQLLPETDGFRLLASLGLQTPTSVAFDYPDELEVGDLECFEGNQVVLKAVCADLAHKTEVEAIRVLPCDLEAVQRGARRMRARLVEQELLGFLIQDWIDYDREVGRELLVSLRWDREFGAILTCGPGGIHAEHLAQDLKEDRALAIASPGLGMDGFPGLLQTTTVGRLMTRSLRGRPPSVPPAKVLEMLQTFVARAEPLLDGGVDDIEINPLVASDKGLVALDVLVRLSTERAVAAPSRPVHKLRRLLEPQTLAIVGVSHQLNPGRLILKNILREGFEPEKVFVIKPGVDEIEGCRCVPSLAALPTKVDLLVVAIGADQVPDLLDRVIELQAAESLIVIPGGLEEQPGAKGRVSKLIASLHGSRQTRWEGPVVNGANCMGIRSGPGSYDTFFLPDYKLPVAGDPESGTALIAQSGAFLAARSSKLSTIAFKYSISIGNQLDLSLSDYLSYLAADTDLNVFGVYVEGFKTLDGLRFLEIAKELRAQNRRVLLYRAGRSTHGAQAASSHTASLTGSYTNTVALARSAGVLVADSMADFEDLLEVAVGVGNRSLGGRSLAAVSNAGFECVAMSDRLGWWQPAQLSPETIAALEQLLEGGGVETLVQVHNPLDVTPMMGDELFARVAARLLADPGVDSAVISCVPLTGELDTLPSTTGHGEDLEGAQAIAPLLVDLWDRTTKPWVAVVDGGHQYDPLVSRLRQGGIPVFRTADRAVEILELYGRSVAGDRTLATMRDDQG